MITAPNNAPPEKSAKYNNPFTSIYSILFKLDCFIFFQVLYFNCLFVANYAEEIDDIVHKATRRRTKVLRVVALCASSRFIQVILFYCYGFCKIPGLINISALAQCRIVCNVLCGHNRNDRCQKLVNITDNNLVIMRRKRIC